MRGASTRPAFQKRHGGAGHRHRRALSLHPGTHLLPATGVPSRGHPVAARVGRETVTLPLFPAMQDEDVRARVPGAARGARALTRGPCLAALTADSANYVASRNSFIEELRMNRHLALALACWFGGSRVSPRLQPGAQAPDFTTQATLAGKPFTFSLADALEEGAGRAVFLSGRVHAGMHGRGARVRRGHGRSSRRWAQRSSASRTIRSTSSTSSR